MNDIKDPMTRVGVIFSSGFFGFFAHAGFLAALREMGIRPCAWAGSSSGAIVAAFAASGMDDKGIRDYLFGVRREAFWDPYPWWQVAGKALKGFKGLDGYLRGEAFMGLMEVLPEKTFEDCPHPIAIAATNLTQRRETVFTSGDLRRAVCASSSVPMLFRPVEIEGCLYVDGGVTSKAPILGLLSIAKVDIVLIHFIASRGISGTGNEFLKKAFTPWLIHDMSVDIARLESYRHQKSLAEKTGVRVVEISTGAPPVGPKSLHLGPSAYGHARVEAARMLGGI